MDDARKECQTGSKQIKTLDLIMITTRMLLQGMFILKKRKVTVKEKQNIYLQT